MKSPDEPPPPPPPPPGGKKNNLPWPYLTAADTLSAAAAASTVAPAIAIIDRSIMEKASGRSPSLSASIRASLSSLGRRPHTLLFSKPSALIFLVYGGTYLTANSVDTFNSSFVRPELPPESVSSGPAKFFASSVANVGLCLVKDRAFVRLFASSSPGPAPVPLPCYALFTLRDCITIFASFNLPPRLAPYLDAHMPPALADLFSGRSAAQFLAPAAVQLISTPLHLLGLDLYARPAPTPPSLRWRAVCQNWLASAAARMCRIVPAFGLGGVINLKLRRSLMLTLESSSLSSSSSSPSPSPSPSPSRPALS
ncbi:hypothetical protein L249_2858 [Ophiocordyceps polyrhachis-furcata BCC 54312]|uniref:Sequence orphan n=1 Tax=Ophiocordyceps polyrhachis-furcata BCC 54312 TaxID=1330021 RepID=A0A367LS40_9HYPO|nr:hypothetical protein L249_2858 [Ophiocordyceps polyrhachis-furcata BCC 54312]